MELNLRYDYTNLDVIICVIFFPFSLTVGFREYSAGTQEFHHLTGFIRQLNYKEICFVAFIVENLGT